MKILLLFLIACTACSSELQLILPSMYSQTRYAPISYVPKSYAQILGSQEHFEYLKTQDSRTLSAYFHEALTDIHTDKNKLYKSECGTSCKKCQAGSIITIATGSPFALLAGWLTHNFCITLGGGIGTFIYLPAVGYYIYKVTSEHEKLNCYEKVLMQWQKELLPQQHYIVGKTMSLE